MGLRSSSTKSGPRVHRATGSCQTWLWRRLSRTSAAALLLLLFPLLLLFHSKGPGPIFLRLRVGDLDAEPAELSRRLEHLRISLDHLAESQMAGQLRSSGTGSLGLDVLGSTAAEMEFKLQSETLDRVPGGSLGLGQEGRLNGPMTGQQGTSGVQDIKMERGQKQEQDQEQEQDQGQGQEQGQGQGSGVNHELVLKNHHQALLESRRRYMEHRRRQQHQEQHERQQHQQEQQVQQQQVTPLRLRRRRRGNDAMNQVNGQPDSASGGQRQQSPVVNGRHRMMQEEAERHLENLAAQYRELTDEQRYVQSMRFRGPGQEEYLSSIPEKLARNMEVQAQVEGLVRTLAEVSNPGALFQLRHAVKKAVIRQLTFEPLKVELEEEHDESYNNHETSNMNNSGDNNDNDRGSNPKSGISSTSKAISTTTTIDPKHSGEGKGGHFQGSFLRRWSARRAHNRVSAMEPIFDFNEVLLVIAFCPKNQEAENNEDELATKALFLRQLYGVSFSKILLVGPEAKAELGIQQAYSRDSRTEVAGKDVNFGILDRLTMAQDKHPLPQRSMLESDEIRGVLFMEEGVVLNYWVLNNTNKDAPWIPTSLLDSPSSRIFRYPGLPEDLQTNLEEALNQEDKEVLESLHRMLRHSWPRWAAQNYLHNLAALPVKVEHQALTNNATGTAGTAGTAGTRVHFWKCLIPAFYLPSTLLLRAGTLARLSIAAKIPKQWALPLILLSLAKKESVDPVLDSFKLAGDMEEAEQLYSLDNAGIHPWDFLVLEKRATVLGHMVERDARLYILAPSFQPDMAIDQA